MHRIHNEPSTGSAPDTTGKILHWAGQYDFYTRLLGFGVNSSSSRMIVEMANIQPGDRVLDVGCGTGNLTLTAKTYVGASGAVYGIDASPEMIAVACKKAKQSRTEVTFEVGLIEKIPYPDASFDVVLSRLMVHHLPDDLKRQAFAEVLRVLKPGGLFFIADFQRPEHPILAHLTLAMVGHRMMQAGVGNIPPLLKEAGFAEVAISPTRSAFLAFVSGRKPMV